MNRLSFDPGRKHVLVLCPVFGDGADFKLLGVVMDAELAMSSAMDNIMRKATPRLKAPLRRRPHFSVTEMMMKSYKAHILCLLKGTTGAVYDARRTVLDRIRSSAGHVPG